MVSENYNILSSNIYKILLSKNRDSLAIEVFFKLLYSKGGENLMLRFSGVEEFSFYYNSQYIFYNVESYKFFKKNNKIYVSFDPSDEDESMSSNDQDFITSECVEGFLLLPSNSDSL